MALRALLPKFVPYSAIGAAAYLVFLTAFRTAAGSYVVNVLGICVGITVSSTLNRKCNFCKTDATVLRAARLLSATLLGMGVSTLIIMALAAQQVDVRLAKAAAILVVFVMRFAVNAPWTFR